MMVNLSRFLLAALGGAFVYLSYEPYGFSLCAVLGLALFCASLGRLKSRFPSLKMGAALGFVHALTCYLLLLPWIGEFVGPMPYVALAITLALSALLTGAVGAALARRTYGFLAFPFVVCAVEFLRSSLPFGGFAWVRLAWGQINGPLAFLASWGGPALVTFALVACAVGLRKVFSFRRQLRYIAVCCFVVPLASGLVAMSTAGGATDVVGSVEVAAVQGNVPRMGLDFNAQRRAVLENHVNETIRLAEDAKRSGQPLDLVIWPENASDVNPFADPEARALVEAAVQAVDAPILVGTLTRDDVGARNTMVVFDPEHGAGDYHHKRFLQPFGEYMPLRNFFRLFSDLVDLAGDFKPGDGPGVVEMNGITVGIATCYEVAEDPAYRLAVRNGAQILATPTNNATFGYTDMTYQQLAMSRLRAIETDRAVVVAATSGVSAIVSPTGQVLQETGIFEAAHLQDNLPLHEGLTFAVRYGDFIEAVLVLIGFALMLGSVLSRRQRVS